MKLSCLSIRAKHMLSHTKYHEILSNKVNMMWREINKWWNSVHNLGDLEVFTNEPPKKIRSFSGGLPDKSSFLVRFGTHKNDGQSWGSQREGYYHRIYIHHPYLQKGFPSKFKLSFGTEIWQNSSNCSRIPRNQHTKLIASIQHNDSVVLWISLFGRDSFYLSQIFLRSVFWEPNTHLVHTGLSSWSNKGYGMKQYVIRSLDQQHIHMTHI